MTPAVDFVRLWPTGSFDIVAISSNRVDDIG